MNISKNSQKKYFKEKNSERNLLTKYKNILEGYSRK